MVDQSTNDSHEFTPMRYRYLLGPARCRKEANVHGAAAGATDGLTARQQAMPRSGRQLGTDRRRSAAGCVVILAVAVNSTVRIVLPLR